MPHVSYFRRRANSRRSRSASPVLIVSIFALFTFFGLPAVIEHPPHARTLLSLPETSPALEQTSRTAAFDRRPAVPASFDEHTADAAVLIDLDYGQPLYERNPDTVRAAASLAKVVTMYVVFDELERGNIDLDDTVTPVPEADWRRMPPGSSLMFLSQGEEVTWHELLLGLAIASGNDAAHAVAYELDGSVEAFADRMNEAVARAGVDSVRFSEPSGISSDNEISAGAFAEFLRHYAVRFPDAIAEYHGRESVSFPKQNRTPVSGAAEFNNRNGLVGEYSGADGLKTGFIGASGYNIAATAERDGRRLISVVLGVEGASHEEGGAQREREAAGLLDYGFEAFTHADIELNASPEIPVAGSHDVPVRMPAVSLLLGEGNDEVRAEIRLLPEVRAPLNAGETVGYAHVYSGDRRVAWQPLFAGESADPEGDVRHRFSHAAAWWRGIPTGGVQ